MEESSTGDEFLEESQSPVFISRVDQEDIFVPHKAFSLFNLTNRGKFDDKRRSLSLSSIPRRKLSLKDLFHRKIDKHIKIFNNVVSRPQCELIYKWFNQLEVKGALIPFDGSDASLKYGTVLGPNNKLIKPEDDMDIPIFFKDILLNMDGLEKIHQYNECSISFYLPDQESKLKIEDDKYGDSFICLVLFNDRSIEFVKQHKVKEFHIEKNSAILISGRARREWEFRIKSRNVKEIVNNGSLIILFHKIMKK